jgi:hypothetical protein
MAPLRTVFKGWNAIPSGNGAQLASRFRMTQFFAFPQKSMDKSIDKYNKI